MNNLPYSNGLIGNIGTITTNGTLSADGQSWIPTTGGMNPSIIWVPKIDLDGNTTNLPTIYYKGIYNAQYPLDDKLTPYPEVKPTPEPLDLIDF